MSKLFGLLGALAFLGLILTSCNKAEPYSVDIAGPFVHERMIPVKQAIDLREPPSGFIPLRWKPGDPTIDPGDVMSPSALPAAKGSWLKRLLRRLCCVISSCGPKLSPEESNPVESTSVEGGVNFPGIPATSFRVPDPVGDIGRNHYVQAVNSAFQIFDTTGNPLTEPLLINVLWAGVTSPCRDDNIIDPVVRYDKQADRWLISGFVWGTTPIDHMCIAVSQTPNPVGGGWFLYQFKAVNPVTNAAFSIDSPKVSVWPDAYYLSTSQNMTLGVDAWALERDKMLSGQQAGLVSFHISPPGIVFLPGDTDGLLLPPSGSPAWFARQVDAERVGNGVDRVEVYSLSVDWANPDNSSFVEQNILPVHRFDSVICSTEFLDVCVPQPDTDRVLETLSVWPQWRLQYRNMGDHETLLFNHTIDSNEAGHAGIRWYELRRSGDAGDWVVFQQGTHQDEKLNYFMGGISMDQKGNIALGYAASGSDEYPGIRIAHRMAGDAPGSMPGTEYVAVEGGGSQTSEYQRWGNYSTMDVDPDDDCTFWYTHEYYEETTESGWVTRIISFKLPECN